VKAEETLEKFKQNFPDLSEEQINNIYAAAQKELAAHPD